MELNQLNSFSFPEHIKVSNCCVWSDDNTVAVIGIKGVFVVVCIIHKLYPVVTFLHCA